MSNKVFAAIIIIIAAGDMVWPRIGRQERGLFAQTNIAESQAEGLSEQMVLRRLNQEEAESEKGLARIENFSAYSKEFVSGLEAQARDFYIKAQELKQIKRELEDITYTLKGTPAGGDIEIISIRVQELYSQLEAEAKDFYIRVQELNTVREDIDNIAEGIARRQLALEKGSQRLKQKAQAGREFQEGKSAPEKDRKNLLREVALLKKVNADLQESLRGLKIQLETRIEENRDLQDKAALLEDAFGNERARLYQGLGTAYTQAKLFDLAIENYETSLDFDPDNSLTHYYLGLLYQHSQGNSEKSLYHFRNYLRLNPEAENKKEVEYLIEMLSR